MTSSFSVGQNVAADNILRPRPVKPGNPIVLRAQNEEGGLKPSQGVELLSSGVSRYASCLNQ